jgi:hypothetical protein
MLVRISNLILKQRRAFKEALLGLLINELLSSIIMLGGTKAKPSVVLKIKTLIITNRDLLSSNSKRSR